MLFSLVQNKLVMFVILNLYLWLLIYSKSVMVVKVIQCSNKYENAVVTIILKIGA